MGGEPSENGAGEMLTEEQVQALRGNVMKYWATDGADRPRKDEQAKLWVGHMVNRRGQIELY